MVYFGIKWHLVRKGLLWHDLAQEKAVLLRSKIDKAVYAIL